MLVRLLWTLVIMLLMLSFPLQVILSSPLPSLSPYLVILIIIILKKFHQLKKPTYRLKGNITIVITIYAILVFIHAIWQFAFAFIAFDRMITSFIVYIFPISFYYYFTNHSKEEEIRTVLIAISICGIISGIYFLYDSYSMLINGKISDFSFKMIDYTISRKNEAIPNLARISPFSRAHGLLEKHTISAAWIAIGGFSMLALLPQKKTFMRLFVILIFGLTILLSFNFTSIIAFIFTILFIEIKGYLLLTGIISKKSLKLLLFIVISLVLVGLIIFINEPKIVDITAYIISNQLDLASGDKSYEQGTFFGNLIQGFIDFPENNLKSFPLGILIGDGFAGWSVFPKGGDFGIVETLYRFGLPFFLTVILGLSRLIYLTLKKINIPISKENNEANYLLFASSVTLYIFFSEIHYSIWNAKSVLPILFICLSLFSKYKIPTNTSQSENKI